MALPLLCGIALSGAQLFQPGALFTDYLVLQASPAHGAAGYVPPPAAVVGAGSTPGTTITLKLSLDANATALRHAAPSTHIATTAADGSFSVVIVPTPQASVATYTATLAESG